MRTWGSRICVLLIVAGACLGCSASEPSARESGAVVHGADGRQEFFDVVDAAQRETFSTAAVALLPRGDADLLAAGKTSALTTWGTRQNLCADERFAEQPTAAFCSGVLVEPDLVLTAAHCLDDEPLDELRILRHYYYSSTETLTAAPMDVLVPQSVVADASPVERDLGIDYAWIELADAAQDPGPTPTLSASVNELQAGEAAISIAASGGVPMKLDATGVIRAFGPQPGMFTADTDTFQGASGSGLFDRGQRLLGILARGADDLTQTQEGCYRTVTTDLATEQFTHVSLAVESLCDAQGQRPLCVEADGTSDAQPHAGCSSSGRPSGSRASLLLLLASLALCSRRFRAAHEPGQMPAQAPETHTA